MTISEFEQTLNNWGRERSPFLFLIDFEMEKPLAFRLNEISPDKIRYNINGVSNTNGVAVNGNPSIKKHPISYQEYKNKFDSVMQRLERGDSYLTNLTVKT